MADFVPLAGFAPDLPPNTPGIFTMVDAIGPTIRGYAGGASFIDTGMAPLLDMPLYSASLKHMNGIVETFTGTQTKIYEKIGSAWTDRSRVGSAYNASVSNPWAFEQFGNTSLAINKTDQLQAAAPGTGFVNVAAPSANLIEIWRGFVVLADTNDGASGETFGDGPARWWTSAYLDYTNWTPSIATQCTTGELVDSPGNITALKTLGDYLIAYKEYAIYVGRDAGSPTVLQFNKLPGNIGCIGRDSVVNIGTAHIFIGTDNIYSFDGNTLQPIGDFIRQWFFADLDNSYKHRIKSLHDKYYGTVAFSYPKLGSNGALTGVITYCYKTNTWGAAALSLTAPLVFISGGYTYDTLPLTTYDSWPEISYDDPFWNASTERISFFGPDTKLYSLVSLSGDTKPSYFISGAYGQENTYSLLRGVTLRYLQKPSIAPVLTHFYTDDLGGVWTQGQSVTESKGRFDILRSAPWHKVRVDFTGFYEISAISADYVQDGER